MIRTIVISIIFLLFYNLGFTQEKITKSEKEHIVALINRQVEAWNEGDLEKFMETYWK